MKQKPATRKVTLTYPVTVTGHGKIPTRDSVDQVLDEYDLPLARATLLKAALRIERLAEKYQQAGKEGEAEVRRYQAGSLRQTVGLLEEIYKQIARSWRQ